MDKKRSISELTEPASYHIRTVLNESHCDISLTVVCQNIDYLISCAIQIGKNEFLYPNLKRPPVVIDDVGGICYTFTCPNDKIIRNGELIKDNLYIDCILTSHFNVATFKVNLCKSEVEKGFSFREEQISAVPNDLLYIYASCYVYTLQKLGGRIEGEFSKRRDQLINLLGELDKIWDCELNGKTNEHEAKVLESALKQYVGDEKLIYSLFVDDFNMQFAAKYVKLKETSSNSRNTKDLFANILPTVYTLNKLMSQTLEIRKSYNITEKLSIGASILTPLLFVPGINIAAIIGGAVGASSLLFSSYNLISLKLISQRYNQGYSSALALFKEVFNITDNSCLPYFYTVEKAIYKEFQNLELYTKTPQELESDWNNIFKRSRFLLNIDNKYKSVFIKILLTVRVNYQIRDILKQDYFIGVVGKKKCGKSTFIEQMLPGENAEASSSITTTEITPYKIVDSVIMLDFPHFESIEQDHKLQFIFTRFLLDYIFLFAMPKKERIVLIRQVF